MVLLRLSMVIVVGVFGLATSGPLVLSMDGADLVHLQLGNRLWCADQGSVLVPFGPATPWVSLATSCACYVVMRGRGPLVLGLGLGRPR